jgi:hypothetical protein
MYFKRDARPKLPVNFRGLSEEEVQAAVKALAYAEVDRMFKDLRGREIVQKKKLHHRCVDRRCWRARACTAGEQCCVCTTWLAWAGGVASVSAHSNGDAGCGYNVRRCRR